MVLFVATAFVTFGFRVLRAAASELKHVGRFLHQIDSGPFAALLSSAFVMPSNSLNAVAIYVF